MWTIIYVIIVVINIAIIINDFYRAKKGPTEKERARLEKKHGHTLTNQDMKSYKSSQIVAGVSRVVVLDILIGIAIWR